jgi:hypothetical protein
MVGINRKYILMATYTYSQITPTRGQFVVVKPTGTINFILDSGSSSSLATLHGQILTLIEDQVKKDRFAELLDWSADFAFAAFCMENNLVIPPAEVPEEPA